MILSLSASYPSDLSRLLVASKVVCVRLTAVFDSDLCTWL